MFTSSANISRILSILSGIIALLVISACSFAPVYGDLGTGDTNFNLSFGEPTSRLEQIVYNDLVAHFSRSSSEDAKHVTVEVSSSNITPGQGSVGVSGLVTVTQKPDNDVVFSGTRTASATYVSTLQPLANQQATNEASERAAHQLAETIRLTLISVLSFPPSQ